MCIRKSDAQQYHDRYTREQVHGPRYVYMYYGVSPRNHADDGLNLLIAYIAPGYRRVELIPTRVFFLDGRPSGGLFPLTVYPL